MTEAMRAIKIWQIGALVVVLFVGMGAAYGAYAIVTRSDQPDLAEDQQLIPVTKGDLVNDVSVNGSLVFPDRETLSFGTQGTVGDVLVEEGQSVAEGQALGTLDAETVASLEKAIAQAEVNLQNAKEALDAAKSPYTALDVAEAESRLSSGRVSLKVAQDALAGLLEPTTKDVAQAESKVANARISLDAAQDALAGLLEPSSQDIAQAESKVAGAGTALQDAEEALARLLQPTALVVARAEGSVVSARLAVENASTALDALRSGPTQDDIDKAQSQADAADTTLANAQRDLTLAQNEWDQKLRTVQESAAAAAGAYQDAFGKWLGAELAEGEADMDPEGLLEAWGADLAVLFDPRSRFNDLGPLLFTEGVPSDETQTRWNEVVVYAWVNFYPGAISPTCDDGPPSEGLCVKGELDDAWDAHEGAREDLDTTRLLGEKAVANAESAITRAEESLETAREMLAELREPADLLEIEAKENQLEVALANLQEAKDELASLMNEPDDADVLARQTQVGLARADLEEAEAGLAELTTGQRSLETEAARKQVDLVQASLDEAETELAQLEDGADSLETDASRKQVDVALAALSKAEEDLAEVLAGAEPLEVALREADVTAALASVDSAVQDLEEATIRAPWSGIVSAVGVEVGQQVNPNVRAFEVVDPTVIRVDGIVDEIDVLFIRAGARASVTMDALPGRTLSGAVSEIAVEPTTQQGVVSYPIGIELETPPGLELPEGLSAVATVVIREDLDVLLVPIDALYGTFEEPIVRVMNDGRIEERAVVLGNNDDYWAVVEDGVAEADLIVMQTERATTGGGFGAFRGLFGGGGGFGGGRRAGGGASPVGGGGGDR